MLQYSKEFDFYNELARLTKEIAEKALDKNAIRAITTFRAKDPDRLREKLIKRNQKKKYENISEIYTDIVDLSGVRVALYFPSDIKEVESIFLKSFNVVRVKTFPESISPLKYQEMSYQKKFSGYSATHFQLALKPEFLSKDKQRFANSAIIEIQVASVLMHAWAEVEHDLVYKNRTGLLSDSELAILDELNGLTLTGEIALERLQEARNKRIFAHEREFKNHFDLASFFHELNINISDTRELYNILKANKLNFHNKLKPFVKKLNKENSPENLTEQLISFVMTDENEFGKHYDESKFKAV